MKSSASVCLSWMMSLRWMSANLRRWKSTKDIEKNLKEQKEREKEQYLEATALEKAAENASVDIPQIMIDHEVDHMVQDFASQLRLQGMTLDMYFQLTGQDEQALREQMKENAEKRVRQRLVLKAIIEKEQITVSDEELDEELEKMAELYQRTKEEIRTMLKKKMTPWRTSSKYCSYPQGDSAACGKQQDGFGSGLKHKTFFIDNTYNIYIWKLARA